MILQLNPHIPLTTPKGPALAQFVIDNGLENDLQWVCFQDNSGECWTWRNRDVRAQKNITAGRDYISPFYNPDDVAFGKKEDFNWISIKDRFPPDDDSVLCVGSGDFLYCVCFYMGEGRVMEEGFWRMDDNDYASKVLDVTHWISLPPVPKEAL